MYIFVANPGYQHAHFRYRVPEHTTMRRLQIAMGAQARIQVDNPENAKAIVRQLQACGALEIGDKRAAFRPRAMLFWVDNSKNKPIDVELIDEGRKQEQVARQNIAAEEHEKAGLAMFEHARKLGVTPNETSIEIQELDASKGSSATGEVPVRTAKDAVNAEIVVSRTGGRKRSEEAKTSGRRRRG